jgi:UDP-N-acetyl-D-glucosamine dehydrogenase
VQNTRFIELAGEINSAMPEYVVHQVVTALNDRRQALNGAKVLVLGLAYKEDVDDDRESPSYVLMTLLKERGAEVSYYDPYVPVIKLTREHPQWAGAKSVNWDAKTIKEQDLILIATQHACVDYAALADWAACIVDTRNAMAGFPTRKGQIYKA